VKFCKICKRLIPKGEESCPFCIQGVSQRKGVLKEDKRRGFVRVPLKERISFQSLSLDPQGKTLSLEGFSQDISLSGIYFEIKGSSLIKSLPYLKVSNIIWMEFLLPGFRKKIRLQGEIKRICKKNLNSLGLGVMFVNVDRRSYRLLDDYISSFLEDREEV